MKNISDKAFKFAQEIVNRDLIRLKRALDKDGYMNFEERLSCADVQFSDFDINKITTIESWEKCKALDRKPNIEADDLCGTFSCRMPYCAIVVAGYILYLNKSGQEHKIKEDREFYAAHKDEIDAKRNAFVQKKH